MQLGIRGRFWATRGYEWLRKTTVSTNKNNKVTRLRAFGKGEVESSNPSVGTIFSGENGVAIVRR
jgi:hypothetical protein